MVWKLIFGEAWAVDVNALLFERNYVRNSTFTFRLEGPELLMILKIYEYNIVWEVFGTR